MGDKEKTQQKIQELTARYLEMDGPRMDPELAKVAAGVSLLLGVGSQEILESNRIIELTGVAVAITKTYDLIAQYEDANGAPVHLSRDHRLVHTAFVCGYASAIMIAQEEKEKGDA